MRRECGHPIDDCPTSCMEALSEMASPEIDEAAAVEWFGEPEEWFSSSGRNAARAALAWKARAEAAEAELESLKNLLVSAIYSPKDRDRIGEAVLNVLASYRARCEAAEYAKDVAYRVQDMAIEKVERLCDLADEKATLMNEWGIETDKSLTECFLRNVWGWKDRALEAEKLASDYETKIGAEMPPDFKDWHQNSPLERPLVAALSLRSLRKRLEHEEETVDRLVGEIDALKKGNAVTE